MADPKPNVVAQSEIGPTSFVEGEGIIQHGPNDPETKAAYAGGDPKVPGTENLRRDAAQADTAVRANTRSTRGPSAGAQQSAAAGGELVAPEGARKGSSRKAAGGTTKAARTPRVGSRKRS